MTTYIGWVLCIARTFIYLFINFNHYLYSNSFRQVVGDSTGRDNTVPQIVCPEHRDNLPHGLQENAKRKQNLGSTHCWDIIVS